jgi:hypothetical protein
MEQDGELIDEAASALEARNAIIATLTAENEKLRGERDEARQALERDRTVVIVACNEFTDAFARRSWLLKGRGPYEWDDDRYRDEFRAAYDEMEAPIKRLQRIGKDWSNCPTDPEEIKAARIDWKARAETAEAKAVDTPEHIVAAAIKIDGVTHSMPAPARHHTILHALVQYPDEALGGTAKQGFLTSTGRFVDRREGASIAVRADQIRNPKWPPDLYSEDLW